MFHRDLSSIAFLALHKQQVSEREIFFGDKYKHLRGSWFIGNIRLHAVVGGFFSEDTTPA